MCVLLCVGGGTYVWDLIVLLYEYDNRLIYRKMSIYSRKFPLPAPYVPRAPFLLHCRTEGAKLSTTRRSRY